MFRTSRLCIYTSIRSHGNSRHFSMVASWMLDGRSGMNKEAHHRARVFSRYQSTATIDDNDNQEKLVTKFRREGVRNVAIVAHVDHGKTTLVDKLLQSCSGEANSNERLLDCGELEKERGITISSKVTRCDYKNTIINIVDTPGHADFAGEVDRILSLVDSVCLVVDAAEGPKSQTKYVTSRALSLGKNPIVFINKVDRADGMSRIESGETESEILDLFDSLGASEEQMNYVTLYGSGFHGWVTEDPEEALKIAEKGNAEPANDMTFLLDRIIELIPAPSVQSTVNQPSDDGVVTLPGESFEKDPFSLAAVTVGYDAYLGRLCTGRITSGSIKVGDECVVLRAPEKAEEDTKESKEPPATSSISGLFVNRGISRTNLEPPIAYAGDVITLAGVPNSIAVGDTITKVDNPVKEPLETIPLAPPILAMEFGPNDGPLNGSEGSEVTPTKIRNRLMAEIDNNVTLTTERAQGSDKTVVLARGELQLGILIEQMRREGFEMVISPPKIMTKVSDDGKILEPYEEVTVDVDSEYAGFIVSALTGDRKAELQSMTDDGNKAQLMFIVPSRGLLGFHSEALSQTRGSAVINHCYLEDREHAGVLGDGLEKGKLISSESGKASAYALASLEARGTLFVEPGDLVYPGMIIGENAKQGDLEVNPVRSKQATNIRTQAKDEKVYLQPPKKMSIEELLGYMSSDEMLEVTPRSIRLRKAELDPVERRKAARINKQKKDAANMNKLKK